MNGHSSECSRVNPKILLTDLYVFFLHREAHREKRDCEGEDVGELLYPFTFHGSFLEGGQSRA